MLDDRVSGAAGADVEVARLCFMNANLLGCDDYGAGIACFNEDAATDDGRGDDSAANEIEHADGSGGALRGALQSQQTGFKREVENGHLGQGRARACSRTVQSRSRVSTTSPGMNA